MTRPTAQLGGPPGSSGRSLRQVRRIYRIGADEFRAVWPMAVLALLWVLVIYGIIIYESLFQLPTLGPLK